MSPDYTINDAFHDGFECGLLYILRFMEENSERRITTNDVSKLIVHLEEKKPWKSHTEWEAFILSHISR